MNEHQKRLLIVADKLDVVHETMPAKRFGFAHWVGLDWEGLEDLSCGTAACAVGWGSTCPELREAGLRLFKSFRGFATIGVVYPDGSISKDVESVAALFDLSMDQFDYLFVPAGDQDGDDVDANEEQYGSRTPNADASAKQVANHIRNFVKYKYGD